jgi:hypothetical protein
MKLRDLICTNDSHENIRRIETHSPHELGTKQCTRKGRTITEIFTKVRQTSNFFEGDSLASPWTDNGFSFVKFSAEIFLAL